MNVLNPKHLKEFLNRLPCPDPECGVKDCNGAPRFKDLSKEEIFKLRDQEEIAKVIITLSKAVLAANQALNIDMGDGEPTYQCCNAVCGHPNCLVGDGLKHALKLVALTENDIKGMNVFRARGNLPPLVPTQINCTSINYEVGLFCMLIDEHEESHEDEDGNKWLL